MNLFLIPKKLEQIRMLNDAKERKSSLLILFSQMNFNPENVKEAPLRDWSENQLVSLIRKKHKEFISRFLMFFWILMIFLSGVIAIWRSI